MASANIGGQEMPRRPRSFARKLFPQQIGWRDGFAFVHDTPGLGVDLEVAADSP